MIESVLDLIGKTPLVKLHRVNDTGSTIWAKLEALNPSGSIKDVMALYMMNLAEKRGELKSGARIIEATSGNTGISFAMLAQLKGYRFMAVMPEYMSRERVQMMEAFGAEIVLTPAADGFAGTMEKLDELSREYPDAWLPRQFDNPDNTAAHREITGKRILEGIKGQIDAFISGVGTGGTLMGVAEALKNVYPRVRIVAVEPAESAVMSGDDPGYHKIQGIGSGFIPGLLNMDLIDSIIPVSSEAAIDVARSLMRDEGLMVGISSGANVIAALKVAAEMGDGKTIVTVLPDRIERYISMDVL
ncbi:MAG: cysteine synthase A [Dehalococcoidia bacterium]|nr:MAG: cysteine synthase A [Dehalococcoidia bacterium]